MHQPQLTQLLSPIGLLSSNEMLVTFPLPIRPMTRFWATSVQARTHRSHRMQALWSIAIDGLEKSVPFEYARGVKGGADHRPGGRDGEECGLLRLAIGRRLLLRLGGRRPRGRFDQPEPLAEHFQ